MIQFKGTSLNLFVKQQYKCHKCKHIGKYDYRHIQLCGRLIEKPWKTKRAPKACENCNENMDYGWGMGMNSYIDDWSGVWQVYILLLCGGIAMSIYLAKFHDVQIFEEFAKLIFGKDTEINK